ncbi:MULTISPECIES: ATP synthase subunit I [Halomonadaceae]|uniref:ATP synthase subunit I n=1 Tax=Halomonadaceae TaxID=28256 RepID=UPI00159823FF|nr:MULTISPECIES: ATP synthase subunit I [Halomonas]QJQ95608.1 F0F1 ATP synthase assembly protein I [Halomonas sp. PA5]
MHNDAAALRRRPEFRRLLQTQLLVTLAVSGVAAAVEGSEAALSAVLGGLVCLLPTLFFVWRGLRTRDSRRMRLDVMNFYVAATGKFGLTVALFVIVFISVPPSNPIFFFVAYVAAQLSHWLTPWLLRDRPTP